MTAMALRQSEHAGKNYLFKRRCCSQVSCHSDICRQILILQSLLMLCVSGCCLSLSVNTSVLSNQHLVVAKLLGMTVALQPLSPTLLNAEAQRRTPPNPRKAHISLIYDSWTPMFPMNAISRGPGTCVLARSVSSCPHRCWTWLLKASPAGSRSLLSALHLEPRQAYRRAHACKWCFGLI